MTPDMLNDLSKVFRVEAEHMETRLSSDRPPSDEELLEVDRLHAIADELWERANAGSPSSSSKASMW
jgi:hypothetical protein